MASTLPGLPAGTSICALLCRDLKNGAVASDAMPSPHPHSENEREQGSWSAIHCVGLLDGALEAWSSMNCSAGSQAGMRIFGNVNWLVDRPAGLLKVGFLAGVHSPGGCALHYRGLERLSMQVVGLPENQFFVLRFDRNFAQLSHDGLLHF